MVSFALLAWHADAMPCHGLSLMRARMGFQLQRALIPVQHTVSHVATAVTGPSCHAERKGCCGAFSMSDSIQVILCLNV